jgi:hypothetical protein
MTRARSSVRVAAVVEAATGLALLFLPGMFVKMMLGVEATGAGVVLGRICGLALLSFGLACWPHAQIPKCQPEMAVIRALLTYNSFLTVYLVYVRTLGGYHGILLMPAILLHFILTILLIKAYAGRNAEEDV